MSFYSVMTPQCIYLLFCLIYTSVNAYFGTPRLKRFQLRQRSPKSDAVFIGFLSRPSGDKLRKYWAWKDSHPRGTPPDLWCYYFRLSDVSMTSFARADVAAVACCKCMFLAHLSSGVNFRLKKTEHVTHDVITRLWLIQEKERQIYSQLWRHLRCNLVHFLSHVSLCHVHALLHLVFFTSVVNAYTGTPWLRPHSKEIRTDNWYYN